MKIFHENFIDYRKFLLYKNIMIYRERQNYITIVYSSIYSRIVYVHDFGNGQLLIPFKYRI